MRLAALWIIGDDSAVLDRQRLDLAAHLRLDLFGGGARQLRPHDHRGDVHRGEAVHAEAGVARGTDDDQRQDDHRGEDRTLDADLGELLHQRIRITSSP